MVQRTEPKVNHWGASVNALQVDLVMSQEHQISMLPVRPSVDKANMEMSLVAWKAKWHAHTLVMLVDSAQHMGRLIAAIVKCALLVGTAMGMVFAIYVHWEGLEVMPVNHLCLLRARNYARVALLASRLALRPKKKRVVRLAQQADI